ncbi:MAG TPA: hypothetical protein VI953_03830 [Candidatus Paceibacterota bacterium]
MTLEIALGLVAGWIFLGLVAMVLLIRVKGSKPERGSWPIVLLMFCAGGPVWWYLLFKEARAKPRPPPTCTK